MTSRIDSVRRQSNRISQIDALQFGMVGQGFSPDTGEADFSPFCDPAARFARRGIATTTIAALNAGAEALAYLSHGAHAIPLTRRPISIQTHKEWLPNGSNQMGGNAQRNNPIAGSGESFSTRFKELFSCIIDLL